MIPRPRTIDSSTARYAEATREAEAAIRHAAMALDARRAARFYSGAEHGLGCEEAARHINRCLKDGLDASLAEFDALKRLNVVLLAAGIRAGEEALVGRSVFLASRPGRHAVYLGSEIPEDLEFEEISRDREIADRATEYSEMTRFAG